jgi:TetR/AcrR family fatty acid metabolism transcriptional regulator
MARIVDRDAKRLKILEAAAARFAQSGYEATSMDDLAIAAEVSKGSLYDYFKNKEDLFYGVFEWSMGRLMTASMERSGALPPSPRRPSKPSSPRSSSIR